MASQRPLRQRPLRMASNLLPLLQRRRWLVLEGRVARRQRLLHGASAASTARAGAVVVGSDHQRLFRAASASTAWAGAAVGFDQRLFRAAASAPCTASASSIVLPAVVCRGPLGDGGERHQVADPARSS